MGEMCKRQTLSVGRNLIGLHWQLIGPWLQSSQPHWFLGVIKSWSINQLINIPTNLAHQQYSHGTGHYKQKLFVHNSLGACSTNIGGSI